MKKLNISWETFAIGTALFAILSTAYPVRTGNKTSASAPSQVSTSDEDMLTSVSDDGSAHSSTMKEQV